MARRHRRQEHEIGILAERVQALDSIRKRCLPLLLFDEEIIDQRLHTGCIEDAFIRAVDDVAGQLEGTRKQSVAARRDEGLERRGKLQDHVVHVADDQRTVFDRKSIDLHRHQYSPESRPGRT